jgi:regulator of protease activity HflC (stomatin/prohibitin superfamily)
MSGSFVLAIVFAVIAGIGILVAIFVSDKDGKAAGGLVTLIAGFACVLTLVASSYTQVNNKTIGIEVSFGKPVGHLSSGLHWIRPWASVTDMDEAVQVNNFTGPDCITVRIADQQTACLTAKVRWKIRSQAADNLFGNYKNSTSGVEDGLLEPELQNVANTVFDSYDPIGLLNSGIPSGAKGNPTVPQLGEQVKDALVKDVGSEIDIVSLTTPTISYDDSVQSRINSVLTQKAQTQIAQQQIKTADAQAQANRALQQSVSNDPNVLISKCLDLQTEEVNKGMTPVTSCFGGSGGGGTTVVVPSK